MHRAADIGRLQPIPIKKLFNILEFYSVSVSYRQDLFKL